MMPDPISHAEMIAALDLRLAYLDDVIRSGYGLAAVERDAMRAVKDHLERTQWRPIEEAPEQVRDLAKAAEDWYEPPASRLRIAHGFDRGPPMHIPTYAFWIGDDSKIHHYFALPPSPEMPR